MIRNSWILFIALSIVSCKDEESRIQKSHPELSDQKTLPPKIRVIGTVVELNPGTCGIFCQGGYVKVDVSNTIPKLNFKSIYLITACMPLGIEAGIKIDVNATIYDGTETECYYQSFNKPVNSKKLAFYKLTEQESAKIHY